MTVANDLFWQIRAAGLPYPIREFRFHPERRWRFDYAWPGAWLAVEVEGGVWTRGRHLRGAGFIRDCEKYAEVKRENRQLRQRITALEAENQALRRRLGG
jgi:hypothetical protein